MAFYFNIPIVKMVNKYAEKTSVITATASGISLYSIIDLAVVLDAKAATSRWYKSYYFVGIFIFCAAQQFKIYTLNKLILLNY